MRLVRIEEDVEEINERLAKLEAKLTAVCNAMGEIDEERWRRPSRRLNAEFRKGEKRMMEIVRQIKEEEERTN
jgi:hypothetical protein